MCASHEGNTVYLWNWIWPQNGELVIGGFKSKVVKISLLKDGTPIHFKQQGHRIRLMNLPGKSPDQTAAIAVLEMVFEAEPVYRFVSNYPQFHQGEVF